MHCISFKASGSYPFESAGRFVSVNHPFHPHRRLRSAVLLLGYAGTYPIAQEGREYLLKPGTFLFLFPEHEHYGIAPASDGQSHFWCHMHLPEDWVITSSETVPASDNCILPEFGYLTHAEKYYILFNQLIDAANRTYASPTLRQSICNGYVSILLNSISNEYCTAQQTLVDAQSQNRVVLAEKVKQWIRLHFREPITSQSIAHALQYNSDYLTQVTKSATGLTLYESFQESRKRHPIGIPASSLPDAHQPEVATI